MAEYLQVEFELGALELERAEAACFEAGALSVTLSGAQCADQCPVLEPQPGEVRLWPATRVQALFAERCAQPVRQALIAQLAELLDIAAARLALSTVADRIWEREWLRDFHALRFGERLWICPQHERVEQPNAVIVTLDPGLAFGTGTHASTALALEWLDQFARHTGESFEARSVIDFGCGSGVLAIAALKLGARAAYAYDYDPQALQATRDNAALNQVDERLSICGRAEQIPPCELLLANILAGVLIEHTDRFAQLVHHAGHLLLSGILAPEEPEVAAAFMKWFDMRRFESRDGWVALAGTRH